METERPGFDDLLQRLAQLSDGQLTQQLRKLNEQKCVRDAELLLYLSEIGQRGLYRQEAVSSLFDFCVSRLGCSEDVAWKRVGAARFMRRYPVVFDLLSTGQIHLSALMLVKPHLTEESHREWLLAACGKSKRQVKMLVARRCPKPDVATSVRKLPEPRAPHGQESSIRATPTLSARTATSIATAPIPSSATAASTAAAPIPSSATAASIATAPIPSGATATPSATAPIPMVATRIAPLSGCSCRVTFTASQRWKQKLDRARELASHVISPSDLPGLLDRALDLLIEREERRRCAFRAKPQITANHK